MLRRHACISVKVSAEMGLVGEVESVCHLLDGKAIVMEQDFRLFDDLLYNDFVSGLARQFLADGGEVFGCDVK